MSDRRLYALTDSEASELRQMVDQAQIQSLIDQDVVTYEELIHLMIPLNTPIDTDAAVERMARAILQRIYGGNVDLLGCDAWGVARGDARAALAALLGTDEDEDNTHMSDGYTVRFVGGPAHGETRKVYKLLQNLRVPVHKCSPLLAPPPETPYTPGVAVYTLVRTLDGCDFYQYLYGEGTTE